MYHWIPPIWWCLNREEFGSGYVLSFSSVKVIKCMLCIPDFLQCYLGHLYYTLRGFNVQTASVLNQISPWKWFAHPANCNSWEMCFRISLKFLVDSIVHWLSMSILMWRFSARSKSTKNLFIEVSSYAVWFAELWHAGFSAYLVR